MILIVCTATFSKNFKIPLNDVADLHDRPNRDNGSREAIVHKSRPLSSFLPHNNQQLGSTCQISRCLKNFLENWLHKQARTWSNFCYFLPLTRPLSGRSRAASTFPEFTVPHVPRFLDRKIDSGGVRKSLAIRF